jgi:hypothetical protein
MLDPWPALDREPVRELSGHQVAATPTCMRLPRTAVFAEPLPSGIHECMLCVGDQLPSEHRLNETLGAIEYGLHRITTGRSLHALTITRVVSGIRGSCPTSADQLLKLAH